MAIPRKRGSARIDNRERRPVIRFQGVRAIWSNTHGWMFRAVVGHDGRRKCGPCRATQELAANDYVRMKDTVGSWLRPVTTLGEALGQVMKATRGRGTTEAWVRSRQSHAAYILLVLDPCPQCGGEPLEEACAVCGGAGHGPGALPIASITKTTVMQFVASARSRGRHVNTIREKDLQLLGEALKVAGLPMTPVADARAELKGTLKRVPPPIKTFTGAEIRELLPRMRNGVWRRVHLTCPGCEHEFRSVVEDRTGPQTRSCPECHRLTPVRGLKDAREIQIPSREADADLLSLLGTTGVRTGELGRVRICDVDLKRGTIRVREPKDRGNPRDLPLSPDLAPIVERLLEAARSRDARQPASKRLGSQAPLVYDSMNRITNLCRRWKPRLEEPRLAGRTFRSSYLTDLASNGVAANNIMQLAGHRRLSTTDRYVQAVSRQNAEHAASLSRRFLGAADAAEAPPAEPPQQQPAPPAE